MTWQKTCDSDFCRSWRPGRRCWDEGSYWQDCCGDSHRHLHAPFRRPRTHQTPPLQDDIFCLSMTTKKYQMLQLGYLILQLHSIQSSQVSNVAITFQATLKCCNQRSNGCNWDVIAICICICNRRAIWPGTNLLSIFHLLSTKKYVANVAILVGYVMLQLRFKYQMLQSMFKWLQLRLCCNVHILCCHCDLSWLQLKCCCNHCLFCV